MRKELITYILCAAILYVIWKKKDLKMYIIKKQKVANKDGINHVAKIEDKNFYIYQNKFEKEFLKGVNLGLGKPGTYPGDFGITKEEYQTWFKQIMEMNANIIRVYTLQSPEFYEALYEFNKTRNDKLYVIHGIWLNEELIEEQKNAYHEDLEKDFTREAKNIIYAIHGNAVVKPMDGHASGIYKKDISSYVIGFIFGIEFEADFVMKTNELNTNIKSYEV